MPEPPQFYKVSLLNIVNSVVIDGFSREDIQLLTRVTVRLQPSLQLHCPTTILQIQKYSSLVINHI